MGKEIYEDEALFVIDNQLFAGARGHNGFEQESMLSVSATEQLSTHDSYIT